MKKSSEGNNNKATDRILKRPQACAKELFGAISRDRRLAKVEGTKGDLVFPNLLALESQLTYAFKKGLIRGQQDGSNRAIHLEVDSALRYITYYMDMATTQTGRVYIPAKHSAIWERADEEATHVVDGDHPPVSLPPELKVEEHSREYAVIRSGSDMLKLVKSNETNKFITLGGAAVAALEQLGYHLIKVERDEDNA